MLKILCPWQALPSQKQGLHWAPGVETLPSSWR